MPIQYPVGAGTILLCDYATGFRPPEMVKRRPAIVISPRLPHRDGLCSVVPLSGTAPERDLAYQCRLELDAELPHPFPQRVWWVKADMLATVAFERLDLFRTERDQYGKRKYLSPKVNPEQLAAVRRCVLHALGFSDLTTHIG
jgi:uncharacterized protein YifN (PemK superfamily)